MLPTLLSLVTILARLFFLLLVTFHIFISSFTWSSTSYWLVGLAIGSFYQVRLLVSSSNGHAHASMREPNGCVEACVSASPTQLMACRMERDDTARHFLELILTESSSHARTHMATHEGRKVTKVVPKDLRLQDQILLDVFLTRMIL